MLLVGRCRAVGVTMLGRHATETRAAAHNMALNEGSRTERAAARGGVDCGRGARATSAPRGQHYIKKKLFLIG